MHLAVHVFGGRHVFAGRPGIWGPLMKVVPKQSTWSLLLFSRARGRCVIGMPMAEALDTGPGTCQLLFYPRHELASFEFPPSSPSSLKALRVISAKNNPARFILKTTSFFNRYKKISTKYFLGIDAVVFKTHPNTYVRRQHDEHTVIKFPIERELRCKSCRSCALVCNWTPRGKFARERRRSGRVPFN